MPANPTNMPQYEFENYLTRHGITNFERKTNSKGEIEIYFPCPFNGCDEDRRSSEEGHCSFNLNSCLYNCFKCGSKGNFITLQKHFGDYESLNNTRKIEMNNTNIKGYVPKKLDTIAQKAFERNPEYVQDYFNQRGINNASINKHKLGITNIVGREMFAIPIIDKTGNIVYFKLRKTPEDEKLADAMNQERHTPKYLVYPAGANTILVGEYELNRSSSSSVLICEGELDRIIAIQEGVKMPVVSGGGGAQTFKDEWIDALRFMRNIYICMDVDDSGQKGANNLIERLAERIPTASIYNVKLPYDANSKADLTNYFTDKKGTADELFTKYAEYRAGTKPLSELEFKELSVNDVIDILDSTIKNNRANKAIVFYAMLSAYTEESQLNIMMNAQSSSGKSYITVQVSKYFPQQDVKMYGRTSSTALYYNENLTKIDEDNIPYIDLERRIVIFTEQPNSDLLAHMRSFLSHDQKKTTFTVTNKGKNGKNTARDSYLLGFSSVIFCTANMRIDEQEQTRCLILSPETDEDAVRAGINASIERNSDINKYRNKLENDEGRKMLKERIQYIKSMNIDYIDIEDSGYLERAFFSNKKSVTAKDQREIEHFISLVKSIALLNTPFRIKNGRVTATNKDIDQALDIWKDVSESMTYGVSPQALDFYKTYILAACKKANSGSEQKNGITIKELTNTYYETTGCLPNQDMLRKDYLPSLERASLISLDKNPDDMRQTLIVPLEFFDKPDGNNQQKML